MGLVLARVPRSHGSCFATRMLLAKEFPISRSPFLALVLVEPTMITRELFSANVDDRMATINFCVAATSVRRDAWDSREAAFDWFKRRLPWKVWDPRVLRLLTVCIFCVPSVSDA